jgi:hypothetical protein
MSENIVTAIITATGAIIVALLNRKKPGKPKRR